jgi:colicin import membrane protein
VLSILVHGGIVAAVGWAWWTQRAPVRAPQQLAIEATVVSQRTASARAAPVAAAAPASPEVPPPVVPSGPTPKQLEAQHAEEQARLDHEREVAAAAAARKEEQESAERAAKEVAEHAAQEQADRAAQEQADRAARDKAKRESELKAQLAAEERVNAARGSREEVAWLALIRDKVTRAWIRPPSARAGVNCEVHVTQVPGGVVTGVQIGTCNGDAAVRESIEAAVYRASPLPMPANADLFDRNLKFNFHPDE